MRGHLVGEPTEGELESEGPEAVEGHSIESDDDPEYLKLLGQLPKMRATPSDLARYKRLEELSWRAESRELRNLGWLLRAKHAESSARFRAQRNEAVAMTIAALICVVFAGYLAWREIDKVIGLDFPSLPDLFWIPFAASTAAILLTVGVATLLFRVAGQVNQRALQHSREADFTRRLEAAVRLAQASDGKLEKLTDAFVKLSLQFATPANGRHSDETVELSSVPDVLHELVALLKAIPKSK